MGHLSLYRKWRPQTFREVVGQNHVTRTLVNALTQDRLAHVYLFAGSRGTGKTSVAKILARAVNCEKGPAKEPCNKCSVCKSISAGKAMDVLEIDAASNRGIDEIRELRERIYFRPTTCRYKVYIVDEVHMLTTEAFNALLKMLEEPPAHTLFVLATTEPHKLPLTVVSRCQRFDFGPLKVADVQARLEEIAAAEQIDVESKALEFIALYAEGSLRDAVGVLDQISSFAKGEIKADDVKSLLGVLDTELFMATADIVASKKTAEMFGLVQELVAEGKDLSHFIVGLVEHFRNLFVIRESSDWERVVPVQSDLRDAVKKQADLFSSGALVDFIEVLSSAHKRAKSVAEPRFVLETTLLELINGTPLSRRSVLSRLEALEQRIEGGPSAENATQAPERPAAKVVSGKAAAQTGSEKTGAEAETGASRNLDRSRKTGKSRRPKSSVEERADRGRNGEGGSSQETGGVSKESGKVTLGRVERVWKLVIDGVKKKKISTYALLLECRPSRLTDGVLSLSFGQGAEFHRAETEKKQNRSVIEAVIEEVLGEAVKIRCVADEEIEGEPTETPEKSRPEVTEGQVEELVKSVFGAESVQESKAEEGRREG